MLPGTSPKHQRLNPGACGGKAAASTPAQEGISLCSHPPSDPRPALQNLQLKSEKLKKNENPPVGQPSIQSSTSLDGQSTATHRAVVWAMTNSHIHHTPSPSCKQHTRWMPVMFHSLATASNAGVMKVSRFMSHDAMCDLVKSFGNYSSMFKSNWPSQ